MIYEFFDWGNNDNTANKDASTPMSLDGIFLRFVTDIVWTYLRFLLVIKS